MTVTPSYLKGMCATLASATQSAFAQRRWRQARSHPTILRLLGWAPEREQSAERREASDQH